MSIFPRVVSSPRFEDMINLIEVLPSVEGGSVEEDPELAVRIQLEPRGSVFQDPILISPSMRDAYEAAEWGLPSMEGEEDFHQNALRMVVAAYSWVFTERRRDAIENGLPRGRANLNSAINHLLSQEPATDEEIWRHVVKRIYGSWKYGLSETVFDNADDFLLRLPIETPREQPWLPPGQLERILSIGEDHFWRRGQDGIVPTLELIRTFSRQGPTLA